MRLTIAETLLPEFDHEMSVTRTMLELFPESQADWKPHPKSFSVSELAQHIATIPGWIVPTLTATELDLAPAGAPQYIPPKYESKISLLAAFDSAVESGRKLIAEASDESYGVLWSLLKGGEVMFSMPRIAVFRAFIIKHIVHHRAQLTVYYRLLDIPLPQIYGPSADAPM